MTDLTKITTPFGLLDEETQQALRDYDQQNGILQYFTPSGWVDRKPRSDFMAALAYRAKPKPEILTQRKYLTFDALNSVLFYLVQYPTATGATKGTAKLTVENGKPTRMVWEADE